MIKKQSFNWDDPDDAQRARNAIVERIKADASTPGSGVQMCHRQGKTAVYLSADRRHIIHHAPDGTIEHKPYAGAKQ